ncbi:HNH endonuclease family protein [Longispora urticae]
MSPLTRGIALLVTAALLGACVQPATGTSSDKPSSNTPGKGATAKTQLAALKTAASRSMAGYSREKFPHWRAQGGGCDTREFVLKREGTSVKTDSACKVTGGSWTSPYDDAKHTVAIEMDIDHMVPLANAWRSGANDWTNEKRGDFANDLDRPQLFAVTASVNRAKGDQDPSTWKPPSRSYWCSYAESWINVKSHWQLTVTEAERTALTDMLGTCT